MDLSPFSAYFQFFAGLAFLYAGSTQFRYAISDVVLQLGAKLDEIKASLALEIQEFEVICNSTDNANSHEDARALAEKMQEFKDLVSEEELHRKFPNGFRSMFLSTGLFCLAVLILSGFAQFFRCSDGVTFTLLSLDTILLFNLFVFVRSLTKKHCEHNLNSWWVFGCMILCILLAYTLTHIPYFQITSCRFFASTWFNEPIIVSLGLVIAASPFILHYFRTQRHKTHFLRRFNKLSERFQKEREIRALAQDLIVKANPELTVAQPAVTVPAVAVQSEKPQLPPPPEIH